MSFQAIADDVLKVLGTIGPVLSTIGMPIGGAISIATSIAQGVAAAEPTAVGLVQSITSGGNVTAAQLQAYETTRTQTYQQFLTDQAAALAAAVAAAA